MQQRLSLFRMVFVLTFVGLAFYVLNQILRTSGWGPWAIAATILWILVVFAIALCQPLYFWGNKKISDSPWVERFQIAGYLAIGYVSDLMTLLLLRDVVGFTVWYGADFQFWSFRGEFLWSGAVSLLLLLMPVAFLFLGALTVLIGPFMKRVKIRDPRIPHEFDGFRILHLSDVHLGPMMNDFLVQRLLSKINKVKFDLMVLTGDIVDCEPDRYAENLVGLESLARNRRVLFCFGNHEFYWNAKRIQEVLTSYGIEVLVNDQRIISKSGQRLTITGAPDPSAEFFQPQQIRDWEKLTPQGDGFHVVLCHQPHLADDHARRGFHLQLSGHTHAGQFFPWTLFIYFFQKYVRGLYRVQGKDHQWMSLYVNQGTGFWGPPNRLGSYSEITLITLSKD